MENNDKLIASLRNCLSLNGAICKDCIGKEHSYCRDYLLCEAADALEKQRSIIDSDSRIQQDLKRKCEELATEIKALKAKERHGRWERIGTKGRKSIPLYPCRSACGTVSAAYRSTWEGLHGPWKYCPACGAKMDLEEDEA